MDFLLDNYMRSSGNGDSWHVDISPATRPVDTYFKETIKTLEYVYANKDGKLYVLYSGGMDSEYVCEVLLHLKMDFTPVIVDIKYNQHDLDYAFSFCQRKNIKPVVIDIDYDKFVDSGEIIEIANNMRCCSYRMPATMKAMLELDGFILLGNDPPYMRKNNGLWQLEEEEVIHSIFNFYKHYNIKGCPFVLSYTPEMMLSFLLDPTMKDLASGKKYTGRLGTNSTKVNVFNNNNGAFYIENRTKYTGYERVDESALMDHPNIKLIESTRPKWNGCFKVDYDVIVKQLSKNLN